MRSRVDLAVEKLPDKALSLSLAHGDFATILQLNIRGIIVRPLDDIGSGKLEGGETLLDDLLEARSAGFRACFQR